MTKLKKAIITLLIFVLCISFVGCSNYTNTQTDIPEESGQVHEDNSAMIEARINEILKNLPACEGWAPSVAGMINKVFHQYNWTYEPYENNENWYVVTFTGTYCPNPSIPNLAEQGTISYLVNIETGEAGLHEDPNGISDIFIIYIIG